MGSGVGVGRGVGAGVRSGVGWGVGFGVGLGVGLGVGGGGTVIVTVPPSSVSLNLSRLVAVNVIVCVPAGSVVDQWLMTPLFQLVLPLPAIAWEVPSITTETDAGADPSRLR